MTADEDPLAVVDEVRFRRLPHAQAAVREHRADHRLDAALAVGPTDEDAADPGLGGSESAEQGARATESESNAEPAPILERGHDLGDVVLPDSHARVTPSTTRQVVLVEDALVEPRREADVGHVALFEVDAATQLAAADGRVLAHERLEQMWRLDGDRPAQS